jgi:LuxR family transcriptional regulator, maltose regulon positive regulatory protein
MAESLPLIATRFHIPPQRDDLVIRPRLRELLERGARLPLTLVSAPPGFGKTMLAAEWAHTRPSGQVAWVSLSKEDNQPSIFWRYVLAALQHAQGGIGATALAMLAALTPPPIETILASAINDLDSLQASLWLVLDDYHLIQQPEIHAGLRFWLDNQPAHFHMVILTREDPPLGLARRRAHRQMVEIRAADLRFNLQETASFLRDAMELRLSPDQVAGLESRTEGWIVGLQMAALSLQGRDVGSFLQSFAGENRFIADYLIEEVLHAQPEAVRRFLLQTSILERMCAPLCAALVGDQQADFPAEGAVSLEYLDRANLFLVALDHQRNWYRYHHLFAELLRQKLSQYHSQAEIAGLHGRASAWFEANGEILAAIQHADLALDEARFLDLLTRYAGYFFTQGELPRLIELTQNLTTSQREQNPVLSMAVSWALLATGQSPEAWLQGIERRFGAEAEAAIKDPELPQEHRYDLLEVLVIRQQTPFDEYTLQTRPRLLAIQGELESAPKGQTCLFNKAASLQAVVAFDLGLDAELAGKADLAVQDFKKTIDLARKDQNHHLLLLAFGHLANMQIAQGRLHAARQTLEACLAEHVAGIKLPYHALAYAGLGALHYEWGDFSTADHYFDEGLPLARLWDTWEALVPLTLGNARLQRRMGDPEAAYHTLDGLNNPPRPELLLPVEVLKMLWQAQEGNLKAALSWLEQHAEVAAAQPTPLSERMLLDFARFLSACQRAGDAAALLQRILDSASAGGRWQIVIEGKIVLAKALVGEGQVEEARALLFEALELAAPEGYSMSFIEEGESIHNLLASVRDLAKPDPALSAYADRLLVGFVQGAAPVGFSPSRAPLPDLLSERELEVLNLVAEGLANAEIAERLYISVSTVKTHTGNIYNKLGVTNRTQALARANQLGLLPRRTAPPE